MAKKTKKILVISDLHSGHKVGFTHPKYDHKDPFHPKLYEHRRMIYKWVMKEAKKLGPYYCMIVNGDCIDGRGEKSGGTELITTDQFAQCKMAAEAIKAFNVPKIYMSYGTGYHTGRYNDFEDVVYELIGAEKIGGEDFIDVNGCIINYRHFIGGSSVPYGRHTAVSKERSWKLEWAWRKEYPMPQIIIRSHVHYYGGAFGAGWVGITTPALQNYGSKYGARQMSGTVDIGFLVLAIQDKEHWSWEAPILRMPYQEPILP